MMEKLLKIVRENPEKAEKMVEEEEKDQDGTSAQLMRIRQPPLMRRKRASEKKVKMGKKKKQISKQKKVEKAERGRQVNSKKRKTVKSKEKKVSEKSQKGKRITNKNNSMLKKKKKLKIATVVSMTYEERWRLGEEFTFSIHFFNKKLG